MLLDEWLTKAKENKEILVEFVAGNHPGCYISPWDSEEGITAPSAEKACEVIRKQIKKEFLGDPAKQLEQAIEQNDWMEINSLLNSAWFGVPESTSCWRIPGFKEAVDLIEDPPDEEMINPDE